MPPSLFEASVSFQNKRNKITEQDRLYMWIKKISVFVTLLAAIHLVTNILTIRQSQDYATNSFPWKHGTVYAMKEDPYKTLPSLNETARIGHAYTMQMALTHGVGYANATRQNEIYISPDNQQNSTGFPFHIFQIGFNKCGTRTLTQFFEHNNIPSCHWMLRDRNLEIHDVMIGRHLQHAPILFDFYRDFMFYADFNVMSEDAGEILLWQILFRQYNNSKFILNIRALHHWLRSRYLHYSMIDGGFLPDIVRKETNATLSDVELLNQWVQTWYTHHCNVIQFFERMNVSHNLLIFDVENDSIGKMVQYFNGFDLNLNGSHWEHQGRTVPGRRTHFSNQSVQWNQITNKYPKLLAETIRSEHQHILNVCNEKVIS
eukprot:225057_1